MKYPIFNSKQLTLEDRLILLSGDELFFIDATVKFIIKRANEAGIDNVTKHSIATLDDYAQLVEAIKTPSLFSEQSLFIIRLNGYPKAPIQKQLTELLTLLDEQNTCVFIIDKLTKKQQQSTWVQAIEKNGKHFESLKLKPVEFKRWLGSRLKQKRLSCNDQLIESLATHYENHLLAANQAIENLALLSDDGKISDETLDLVLSQQSQYTIFQCADEALSGNPSKALAILSELKANRAEPILILWSLSKELRLLALLLEGKEKGQPLNQLFRQANIWQSKTGIYHKAVERHNKHSAYQMLQQAKTIDASIKGLNPHKPWDELYELVGTLSLTSEFLSATN